MFEYLERMQGSISVVMIVMIISLTTCTMHKMDTDRDIYTVNHTVTLPMPQETPH